MRSPILAGVAASAGTFVVMGGATLAVSAVSLTVARRVIRYRKLKVAARCPSCQGLGFQACDICQGKGKVRCRTPVPLRVLVWRKGPTVDPGSTECACPACGTTLQQRCLNCLGERVACQPT